MSAMGIGLLLWYYSGAITRQSRTEAAAKSAAQARAKGEMPLPPLGRIDPPRAAPVDPVAKVLGPAPELPDPAAEAAWRQSDAVLQAPHASAGPPTKSPGDLAFERRLAGVVFARSNDTARAQASSVATAAMPPSAAPPGGSGELAQLLQPTATPAVSPNILPTREFLLAKGAFIDCTLETAVDSTLPGMVTCITATDTLGAMVASCFSNAAASSLEKHRTRFDMIVRDPA